MESQGSQLVCLNHPHVTSAGQGAERYWILVESGETDVIETTYDVIETAYDVIETTCDVI